MTDPTRPNPTRPADESPAMGDHPEPETEQAQRTKSSGRRDRLSSTVVAGIIALIILVGYGLILLLT